MPTLLYRSAVDPVEQTQPPASVCVRPRYTSHRRRVVEELVERSAARVAEKVAATMREAQMSLKAAIVALTAESWVGATSVALAVQTAACSEMSTADGARR